MKELKKDKYFLFFSLFFLEKNFKNISRKYFLRISM